LRERDARIELAGGFVDETLDPEIASDRPAHFGLIALLDALRDNYEIAQERAAVACCHIALDRECCIASLPADWIRPMQHSHTGATEGQSLEVTEALVVALRLTLRSWVQVQVPPTEFRAEPSALAHFSFGATLTQCND